MQFIKCAASIVISSFERCHQDFSLSKNRKPRKMYDFASIIFLDFWLTNFYNTYFIGVFTV